MYLKQLVGQTVQYVVAEVQFVQGGQPRGKVLTPADQVIQTGDLIGRHIYGDDGAVWNHDGAPL